MEPEEPPHNQAYSKHKQTPQRGYYVVSAAYTKLETGSNMMLSCVRRLSLACATTLEANSALRHQQLTASIIHVYDK